MRRLDFTGNDGTDDQSIEYVLDILEVISENGKELDEARPHKLAVVTISRTGSELGSTFCKNGVDTRETQEDDFQATLANVSANEWTYGERAVSDTETKSENRSDASLEENEVSEIHDLSVQSPQLTGLSSFRREN